MRIPPIFLLAVCVRMRPASCSPRARETPVQPTKLLIIEDDADLLALLTQHPDVEDYAVAVARSPAAALQAAAADAFDVVLVDLGGSSEPGLDATRAIKERSPS